MSKRVKTEQAILRKGRNPLVTQQLEVSVIIPVFNGEEYIGRCLDALQASNTAAFEIIVVDDC